MPRAQRNPGPRIWQPAFVGPLVILALFAHAVLMAKGDGAAEPTHHAATGQQHAEVIVSSAAPTATDHQPPEPSHPDACTVVHVAVSAAGNDVEPAFDGVTTAVSPICIAASPGLVAAEATWREPSWPPGIRRALLQVYRI